MCLKPFPFLYYYELVYYSSSFFVSCNMHYLSCLLYNKKVQLCVFCKQNVYYYPYYLIFRYIFI